MAMLEIFFLGLTCLGILMIFGTEWILAIVFITLGILGLWKLENKEAMP